MKLTTLIRISSLAVTSLLLSTGASAQKGPVGPGICTAECTVVAITAEETATLIHMRQEEKLARDVYQFFAAKWGLAAFERIAQAEATHYQQIGALLEKYGVEDPIKADTPGVYTDEKFIALYAEMTGKGSASIKAALEVGVAIEVLDIADLAAAVKETSKFDLRRVYTNLMNASLNHQEAFEFQIELVP